MLNEGRCMTTHVAFVAVPALSGVFTDHLLTLLQLLPNDSKYQRNGMLSLYSRRDFETGKKAARTVKGNTSVEFVGSNNSSFGCRPAQRHSMWSVLARPAK